MPPIPMYVTSAKMYIASTSQPCGDDYLDQLLRVLLRRTQRGYFRGSAGGKLDIGLHRIHVPTMSRRGRAVQGATLSVDAEVTVKTVTV